MRSLAIVVAVGITFVGGCGSAATEHCEARQAYWEHAFADEDPMWAQTSREQLVPSCTKMLSGKTEELKCRDRCLDEADKATPRGSEAARDAYAAFTRCEATCLGGEGGGPRPVSAP